MCNHHVDRKSFIVHVIKRILTTGIFAALICQLFLSTTAVTG